MSLHLAASDDELRSGFLALRTRRDVANLLEVDEVRLIYHLYVVPRQQRYMIFQIPKKAGGFREISAPATALKILQQKLSRVLQCVYDPKPSAHGFVRERSIVTSAVNHCGKTWVFNADLADFFPSINFGRVRGLFMAVPYNLNPVVATILAQICCFDNALPQGAPTSPVVSNMICAKMDSQLQRLAKKHLCFYTRYADDLTFSTSLKVFPFALGRINAQGQAEIGDELLRIITGNGFEVNLSKVRLQGKHRRQEVTGLTVNEKPNVRRTYVRRIRAMLHAWRRFGLDAAEREYIAEYCTRYKGPFMPPPQFERIVKGNIEFLGMVRGKDDAIYLRLLAQLRELAPHLVSGPLYPREALLEEFEALELSQGRKARQRRGYQLENLLGRTFELYGIAMRKPFRRNRNAEQIDGAFVLDNWSYVVEARWRTELADGREVDGLSGQLDRSGTQTLGLFISINGWSSNVPGLVKQKTRKNIVLMNGDDLRTVLGGKVDLAELLRAKRQHLDFEAEPFYGAEQYLEDQGP